MRPPAVPTEQQQLAAVRAALEEHANVARSNNVAAMLMEKERKKKQEVDAAAGATTDVHYMSATSMTLPEISNELASLSGVVIDRLGSARPGQWSEEEVASVRANINLAVSKLAMAQRMLR
tara:strand:+ start:330 stop:692 length:363 start_codon:yes stop_codon:yes gene_type:complete